MLNQQAYPSGRNHPAQKSGFRKPILALWALHSPSLGAVWGTRPFKLIDKEAMLTKGKKMGHCRGTA